jgi:hypothetical protein
MHFSAACEEIFILKRFITAMSIKESHIRGEAVIPQSDNDLGPFSEIRGILIK